MMAAREAITDPAALLSLLMQHGPVAVIVGTELSEAAGIPAPALSETSWSHWRPRMQQIHETAPGREHRALRALIDRGLVAAVISDADDVLLEEAGIDAVELVPTVGQSHCGQCGYTEPLACLLEMEAIPICAACGAVLTPGPLTAPDEAELDRAKQALAATDLVLVVGSPGDAVSGLLAQFEGRVLKTGVEMLPRLDAV